MAFDALYPECRNYAQTIHSKFTLWIFRYEPASFVYPQGQHHRHPFLSFLRKKKDDGERDGQLAF
jgi:hypothetical protein